MYSFPNLEPVYCSTWCLRIWLFNMWASRVVPAAKNLTVSAGRHKRCWFRLCVGNIPWSRKWQHAPVFLPRKLHGQRRLAGYSPRGCRAGHDWVTEHRHTHSAHKVHWKVVYGQGHWNETDLGSNACYATYWLWLRQAIWPTKLGFLASRIEAIYLFHRVVWESNEIIPVKSLAQGLA